MEVLFFDCESNGLAKDRKAKMSDVDNWPRVIQLAFQVADFETEKVLMERCVLIEPDGWEIPKEKFWIDNGFDTEKSKLLGKPMPLVLDDFIFYLDCADVLVAHNLPFDLPVVGAEMFRYGKDKQPKRKPDRTKICTMTDENVINFCQIPFGNDHRPWMNKSRGYKWPSLAELHLKLFGQPFEKGHDAGEDVSATRKCFFKLVDMGILTINEPAKPE